jgi:hypothetical protein
MVKVLLMSVLIVTILIPGLFASTKNAKAGARKVIVSFGFFMAFWSIFVAYYYTEMLGPVDLDPFKTKENEQKAQWQ